jgi:XTP/dITP diphosphohydrolase
MELIFATQNKHKLEEVQALLAEAHAQLISLDEKGFKGELAETHETLDGNAIEKAEAVWKMYGMPCFADDTGLEVEALDGRPGVYSARYAGPGCSFDDNVNKLLEEMDNIENRKACFRCVIALIMEGKIYTFEGRVDGTIIKDKKGGDGFGYDPVFLPDGFNQTFAEMPLDLKNSISHRGRAVEKLMQFLKNI